MSTKASTYISVWTPRSFKSDSAIIEPTVFGMPPMPSCKHAPFGISSTINFATAISTSVGAPPEPNSPIGGFSPSTIKSTSEIWTLFSKPPRQRGIFWLTSTMIFLEVSHTAIIWEAFGPKLKYPCASIGETWNIATSSGVSDSR